jgi:cobyrinic acid a,c-diamide synthase
MIRMARFSGTKGFILGAVSSDTGKTAVTSAICRLLGERGMSVQPFKTGPDFIDVSYLTVSSGRTCRNLDGFPCPELMPFFYADSCSYPRPADIAVVEGVMGLYDGLGPDGEFSTAWLARTLDLPVILLIDARSAATSVAATAKGFAGLEPLAPQIAGVIANRVSGGAHAELIREALGRFAGLPLLGWLPNVRDDPFPSRHLGLVPASEHKSSAAAIGGYARALSEHLDTDALLAIAREPSGKYIEPNIPRAVRKADGSPVRVVIADDDAFSFHYRENWRLLERLGAEIETVSPINGSGIPNDADLLILPGGYPEEFSAELSDNAGFMESASAFARKGCVYAECGGMLYLSRSLSYRGEERAMAGVIAADVKMTGRLSRFGYVEGTALRDNLIARAGESVRAHEFHYSALEGAEPNAYSVKKFSRPAETWTDGYVLEDGRVLASYLHINFYSRPESAARMLKRAARFSVNGQ